MSLLVLDKLVWPGGPAEGFSREMEAGRICRWDVPAPEALGRAIMGEAGSGRVVFKGEDISSFPAWERARRGLFLAWASRDALPGLGPAALLRAGLEARKPLSSRLKSLRSFLAGRIPAEDWDQAPDSETAWTFALLAADCLEPELTIYCPPLEASAAALAGRPGNGLILMEKQ